MAGTATKWSILGPNVECLSTATRLASCLAAEPTDCGSDQWSNGPVDYELLTQACRSTKASCSSLQSGHPSAAKPNGGPSKGMPDGFMVCSHSTHR